MSAASRRVVVTGIGLITPLGDDCATTWTRLISGESGLVRLSQEHLDGLPRFGNQSIPPGLICGGPAPETSLTPDKMTGEPIIDLALQAAQEAVTEADAEDLFQNEPQRAGVVFGTSKGGLRSYEDFTRCLEPHGQPDRDAARFWTQFLSDTPALSLARKYDCRATALCPVAACATGLTAIQVGADLIQRDRCDVVVTGSSDASLLPVFQASFQRLGVLAREFSDPQAACRPFDQDREGFLIGEGAAVLILEEHDQAVARGVKPYAEWLGGGHAADTSGLTKLEPGAPALQHLLKQLPDRCGFSWEDVDYLNLHGTGTEMNDACEAAALQAVLGDHAARIPASSLKGAMGHLLGASGSVETALTLLALKHQRLPGNRNLETPFQGCRLNLIGSPKKVNSPKLAVKLSLGFGGHLAAGVFRAWS